MSPAATDAAFRPWLLERAQRLLAERREPGRYAEAWASFKEILDADALVGATAWLRDGECP